eukprot:g4321.t1
MVPVKELAPFGRGEDIVVSITSSLALLFFLYYTGLEIFRCCKGCRRYMKGAGAETYVHVINIVCYYMQWGLKIWAWIQFPSGFDIDSDAYINYRSYAEIYRQSRYINAINSFLCWFKVVLYMSLVPSFALVVDTTARAAPQVGGFMLVFAMILFAFVSMMTMCFGTELDNYRDFLTACFTLVNALLGDMDFHELRLAHWFIGPILFILFVFVGVFITFNILIAIISDAYADTQDALKDADNDLNMGAEMVRYVRISLYGMPVCGNCFRAMCQSGKLFNPTMYFAPKKKQPPQQPHPPPPPPPWP